MQDSTSTEIQPFDSDALGSIVKQAPGILVENQNSHDKAVGYGNSLLQQAEAGMNDNLDNLMSTYLDKLRLTHKTMNERRKPFTQLVQEVTKRFTALEAAIDPAGKSNIFSQIQTKRNDYAAEKIADQKRREQEARAKLERDKEIISLKNFAETSMRQAVSNYTESFKLKMLQMFENFTLENIDNAPSQFSGIEQIDPLRLVANQPLPFNVYVTREEAERIVDDSRNNLQLINELKAYYSNAVSVLRKELIDKIPSKKAELQAIATASKAEAERIKQEAEKRRIDNELRMKREADDRARAEAEAAKAKEDAEMLDATVNTQADLFQEAPKVKEGCSIKVKNPAAYQLIFMFWWEREGKTWPDDKIEKMTIARMKAFCEKKAVETGEEITSQLVEYNITYKAK